MSNRAFMNPSKQHLGYRFDKPPVYQRKYNNNNKQLKGIRWKTATVLNRRAYVGNTYTEDLDGVIKKYPDGIFKSDPNKFDLFREKSKIEVSINDGESITCLSSFGDRLLEFKNNTLNIINVSNELEYLESSHTFMGTHSENSVIQLDIGVVWISQIGVHLFDGKQIRNLIEKNGKFRLSSSIWDDYKSSTTANSSLGYDPENRQLIVFQSVGYSSSSNNNVLVYDFRQDAWTYGSSALQTLDRLSPVTYKNKMYIASSVSVVGLSLFEWLPVASSADNGASFELTTKDYDFGAPGVRKRIHKVYITYKTGHISNPTNIQAQYYVNGDTSSAQNFSVVDNATLDGSIAEIDPPDTANQYSVCVLKPATSSIKSNIYSMRLKLFVDSGQAKRYDFEINDITIIYRLKNPK